MIAELTAQERERFAAWLEKEAGQSDAMARQAESMKSGNRHDVTWDQAAKRERM